MRTPWSWGPGPAPEPPRVAFRIMGIPVRLHPLALLGPAWLIQSRPGPLAQCVWVAVAVASVLWHELGHALAMRACGFSPSIALHAAGGVTHWPWTGTPTARERLAVTLCGPAAGLALGAAAWLAARATGELPGLAGVALADAAWINLGWSLANLLPVLPLDGALALDALAELASGVRRPRWVGLVSILAGSGGALWAASRGLGWAAGLGLLGALEGWARWRGVRVLPFRLPVP